MEQPKVDDRQFLTDAIRLGKIAKAQALKQGGVSFSDLRRLDMDIKTCEAELAKIS